MTNESENNNNSELVAYTSDIVAAYVSNNDVARSELPEVIVDVYKVLLQLTLSPNKYVGGVALATNPAVSVDESIHDDYLICLEDGKKFKSLKRHLRTHYNLTPEQYREKWGLPADYPMVAPNYAQARSSLAKQMGLGQKRGSSAA